MDTMSPDTMILTHQVVSDPESVKDNAQTVDTELGATVSCCDASVEATAKTNSGSLPASLPDIYVATTGGN